MAFRPLQNLINASALLPTTSVAKLFIFAAVFGFVTEADGSFIQGVGDNFVAIEAENYDTLTGTTFIATDTTPTLTSAYGSAILPLDTNASSAGALLTDFTGSSSRAGYDITFNTVGTYYVYVRYSLFENNDIPTNYGNEDSFLLTAALNTPAGGSNLETIDLNSLGFTPASGEWEGTFRWIQAAGRDASGAARQIDRVYNVTAGDLGTPMTLSIGSRERGTSLDMIVLSTIDNLTESQLNQFVVVPEPSGAFLLSFSISGLAFLRRRRRSLR